MDPDIRRGFHLSRRSHEIPANDAINWRTRNRRPSTAAGAVDQAGIAHGAIGGGAGEGAIGAQGAADRERAANR